MSFPFTPQEAAARIPVLVVRPGKETLQACLVYAPPPDDARRADGERYSQRATVVLPSGKHLSVKPEHLERVL